MENKKVICCKVCGNEIDPVEIGENHYIVRNSKGLITVENLLFDAFDCPVCKCQNILGERKIKVKNDLEIIPNVFVEKKEHNPCFGDYEISCDYKNCKEIEECKNKNKKSLECFGDYFKYSKCKVEGCYFTGECIKISEGKENE